jgi:5-methyltetrahydropteroyltriglutamate--homocysteine methyltransferase
MMLARSRGDALDEGKLWERVASATKEVVRRQAEIGLDVISDGEYGKPQYVAYVRERLSGFDGPPAASPKRAEQDEFPDWNRSLSATGHRTNDAPVALRDTSAVQRDIANFKVALENVVSGGRFMTAASPGVITYFMPTTYYKTDEAYLEALAEAMAPEYRAIVEAGFTLQIDCPDLGMGRSARWAHQSLEEFRKSARGRVAALNSAIAGLPRMQMRIHLCWGNYEGPHKDDVPLADVIDIAFEANVGAVSFEGANPRHEHEWKVFRDVHLPDGMKIIPGVIDSCTNYVEHPELVADRLVRFAELVGPERMMAGVDCGFGTSVGPRHVAPSIAWAKLASLVEGARLASAKLKP